MVQTSDMGEQIPRQERKTAAIEKAAKAARQKVIAFHQVFADLQGQTVLKEIKAQFDPPVLSGETQHESAVRAAQRDVVRWIEDCIIRGKENAVER